MGKNLVTIATFDQPAQARLAKNALDDAGIQATVGDESLVTMDWLLSNAIGGVKVQVWDEDADKAIAALENKFGENGEGFGVSVSPEDLAAQAEAATPDEGEEQPEAVVPSSLVTEESSTAASNRDDYARRAVFSAILGLLIVPSTWYYSPLLGFACIPFLFYALYLILNAAFGDGEISRRGRFNSLIGGVLTVANLSWIFLLLKLWAKWS